MTDSTMTDKTRKLQRALLWGIPYEVPLDITIDEALENIDEWTEPDPYKPQTNPTKPMPDKPKATTHLLDTDNITVDRLEQKHKGKRYNEGKNRLDLIPAFIREQLGRVLTKGAQKYEDRNWEKGMAWSNVLASLERHLNAFKAGEDYDPETGELHVAHLMTNAMFLVQYYKTYPQGDDRPHQYLDLPKVGLDVDEVLCDWLSAWVAYFDIEQEEPDAWQFSYDNYERFQEMEEKGQIENFYLNLDPLVDPANLPFEPHCYITSRSLPTELTQKWIEKVGFPTAPVHTVGHGQSKVEVAKESGIEIFVDDSFKNFKELNNAGVCTFLMDRPHNRKYDVGYKRIHSLDEIFQPLKRN